MQNDVINLPEDKGTYVLVLQVRGLRRMEVGRLGTFDIRPGFYAYVGSAHGAGGLRARIAHHIESIAAPHWHIDYLMLSITGSRPQKAVTSATDIAAYSIIPERESVDIDGACAIHDSTCEPEPTVSVRRDALNALAALDKASARFACSVRSTRSLPSRTSSAESPFSWSRDSRLRPMVPSPTMLQTLTG